MINDQGLIYHIPVLLDEAIEFLKVKPGKKYIDATLGGGGHAAGILEKGGEVLGIDLDQDAFRYVKKSQKLKVKSQKLIVKRGNFRDLGKIAKENGFGKVAGIIFDLGVSTHQLETASRGFSFNQDGRLDMRMDQSSNLTAYEIVNKYSKDELFEIFSRFGEEFNSWPIADAIISARKLKEIVKANQLAEIIAEALRWEKEKKIAETKTRIFQALRIAVNDELESLKKVLPQALELLEVSGRLVVISFHSLEDRIVKNFFRRKAKEGGVKILTRSVVLATPDEIEINRKAKHGKLRALEKL